MNEAAQYPSGAEMLAELTVSFGSHEAMMEEVTRRRSAAANFRMMDVVAQLWNERCRRAE